MASDVDQSGGLDFRLPCVICCRRFVPEALERHTKICEKTAQKKRKVFDSAKQRFEGTDIPTVKSAPAQLSSPPARRKNKSPARKPIRPTAFPEPVGVAPFKSTSSAPSLRNRSKPDLVQCPTCERNFSDKAAERHIPWCRDLKCRIPRSPPSSTAQDRLNARILYRAPPPGSKRGNSPPRTLMPGGKSWSTQSNYEDGFHPSSMTSPGTSVKVTGTAIAARSRNGGIDRRVSPSRNHHGSVTSLHSGMGGPGGSLPAPGMIHSTSWEWFTPTPPTKAKPGGGVGRTSPKRNGHRSNGNGNGMARRTNGTTPENATMPPLSPLDVSLTADEYDPYQHAQRQMEELLMGTTPVATPSITPSISPKVQPVGHGPPRLSTNQVRESKLRGAAAVDARSVSSWSLESDDRDLEEILEDLTTIDDEPEIIEHREEDDVTPNQNRGGGNAGRNKPNWLPRKAVTREEALFGTKNSTGSQDSDYGSLLIRRSPSSPVRLSPSQRNNFNRAYEPERNLCTSNSSSEASLPPLCRVGNDSNGTKMPRFCHDCGTKYPVSHAKFCCECGARRLQMQSV